MIENWLTIPNGEGKKTTMEFKFGLQNNLKSTFNSNNKKVRKATHIFNVESPREICNRQTLIK